MDPKSQPCPQKKIKGRVCASIWIITDPHPLTFHLSVSPSALVMPVINLPRPWADVVGPQCSTISLAAVLAARTTAAWVVVGIYEWN